jgi:hypothetical protein
MIPACGRPYIHFLYFTVDIAVGGGLVPEVVVLDDLFRHVCYAQLHVFVPVHWGVQVKVLDVPGVEMVLLMRILMVSRLAVGVPALRDNVPCPLL